MADPPETGWIKDPFDARDYMHRLRAVPRPRQGSNAALLTPTRNQGRVRSCVGQGAGTAADGVKKKLGIYTERASATWVYNGARFMEGTLQMDCGCRPRDAMEWLLARGILLEHYWPYNPDEVDRTAPSSTRMKQADRYKGFAYFRCGDGIDGIADALSAGHLITIGAPWFREWNPSPACGRLPTPTKASTPYGSGHLTVYYAWDDDEGVFFGINSWGTTWADAGKYIMPYEAIDMFKYFGGYDAQYLTFQKQLDTSPIPTPPLPCLWSRLWLGALKREIWKSPSFS